MGGANSFTEMSTVLIHKSHATLSELRMCRGITTTVFHCHKMLSHLPWFIIVSGPQLHFVQVFQVAAVRAGAWWYSHNTALTLSMLTASSVTQHHSMTQLIQCLLLAQLHNITP